ncbi:C-terminal binding protein [Georgenia sp. AZ-5]|uniref:C-terminal binding protein n=1 Tax=Georgenia sp. AZ-5 TaxID=3367526 RepID=UPI00375414CB
MRIVITDCDHPDVDIERRAAADGGVELRLEQCRTEDDVVARCADADGLLVQYAPITGRVLDALPGLKVVSRYGVGVDTVDVAAASRRGVVVANVPDYGTEEVSDHAVALLLTLARATAWYDASVKAGSWDAALQRPLHRIQGSVLGVVGFGAIGRVVARKARGLGYEVIAHEVTADPGTTADDGTPFVTLADLLARSHAVSLHVPYLPATHHLLDERRLRLMRPEALLVNTARGGLIDIQALMRVLDSGLLRGVALDVLESEPPDRSDPVLRHPRVVVTPHAGWYSEESMGTLKARCVRNALDALAGRPVAYAVTP